MGTALYSSLSLRCISLTVATSAQLEIVDAMKTTEISASINQLLLSSEQSAQRSQGIHVSDIIRHMKTALGQTGKWPREELETAGQVGRIWENLLASALAAAAANDHRYIRPGEFERDGIVGSPDCIDTVDIVVTEFKACWASSRHEPFERRPDWRWQIMAYCYMTGIPLARLCVLYINGDYKPPMPIVKGWQYEFTMGELRSNWEMMRRNRDDLAT